LIEWNDARIVAQRTLLSATSQKAKPISVVNVGGGGLMGKYTSVSIPKVLKEEIIELIFEKDWLGYRNASEFVVASVRNQLSRAKMEISSQKDKRHDNY
jgi:hypothetical protein